MAWPSGAVVGGKGRFGGGGYYKSCEHIEAAINRESCSQSCLLLLLQFQNSDFVAGMGDE